MHLPIEYNFVINKKLNIILFNNLKICLFIYILIWVSVI
jgi:hypothetical protein